MENYNIKVGLQGVAWREMRKAQILEAGLLRLSFETNPNDQLWLARFKNAMIQHKNREEEKHLRLRQSESSETSIGRKTEDQALPQRNTRAPKRYMAEKWAAYKGNPKVPHRRQWSKDKTATDKKEVLHKDWDKAHDTIRNDVKD